MLTSLVQKVLISILFILSIHHLLIYLQTTLTTAKHKDLFYGSTKKYEAMYDVIRQGQMQQQQQQQQKTVSSKVPAIDMKNELKEYVQKIYSDGTA